MSTNVRPENMERITTPELAAKFIEEQVAEVRAQVGDKKVLLALQKVADILKGSFIGMEIVNQEYRFKFKCGL